MASIAYDREDNFLMLFSNPLAVLLGLIGALMLFAPMAAFLWTVVRNTRRRIRRFERNAGAEARIVAMRFDQAYIRQLARKTRNPRLRREANFGLGLRARVEEARPFRVDEEGEPYLPGR